MEIAQDIMKQGWHDQEWLYNDENDKIREAQVYKGGIIELQCPDSAVPYPPMECRMNLRVLAIAVVMAGKYSVCVLYNICMDVSSYNLQSAVLQSLS